jgi:hypothetical protein
MFHFCCCTCSALSNHRPFSLPTLSLKRSALTECECEQQQQPAPLPLSLNHTRKAGAQTRGAWAPPPPPPRRGVRPPSPLPQMPSASRRVRFFSALLSACVLALGAGADGDGAAMQALRQALAPPGWGPGADHCAWRGVTCAGDGAVTAIDLPRRGLRATSPRRPRCPRSRASTSPPTRSAAPSRRSSERSAASGFSTSPRTRSPVPCPPR